MSSVCSALVLRWRTSFCLLGGDGKVYGVGMRGVWVRVNVGALPLIAV